jgi:hypothetical protein
MRHVNSEPFPPNFPARLGSTAFLLGNEAAWSVDRATEAVDWFGSHGFAVLGTELWVLTDDGIQSLPRGISGARQVHGNVVDSKSGELWEQFVSRAAAETRAYLQAFDPSEIREPGKIFFNVVWVEEKEFPPQV